MTVATGELVIVALSGGVDSAVAALRLLRAGHRVEALHMTNWDDADPACTARQDLVDARAVADELGIPLHHANFAREYRDQVFTDFVAGYRDGRTPNPDVDCNRYVKFGACLDHARRLGAGFLATGHYARVDHGPPPRLLTARDSAKDQTYFLHAIEPAALARALFPLGDLTKAEVRRLAADAGLPVHAKRDSTGICFIGKRSFRDFLAGYVPEQPGAIVTADGTVLGQHRGLAYYTLGQRHGFGVGGQRASEGAWYVADKRAGRNELVVVQGHDHPWLWADRFAVAGLRWLHGAPGDGPLAVRTRHRQPPVPCTTAPGSDGMLAVTTRVPVFAPTPGQYAVFYRGDECLGGGVIAAVDRQAGPHPL
jgi:tRNA-specific 2-thiouridylase